VDSHQSPISAFQQTLLCLRTLICDLYSIGYSTIAEEKSKHSPTQFLDSNHDQLWFMIYSPDLHLHDLLCRQFHWSHYHHRCRCSSAARVESSGARCRLHLILEALQVSIIQPWSHDRMFNRSVKIDELNCRLTIFSFWQHRMIMWSVSLLVCLFLGLFYVS